MLLWAHPGPNPKRHFDRFSRFRTAHGRKSQYFATGCPFSSLKLPIPMGRSGPPCNTWFFGPSQVLKQNDILIGSAVFAQLTAECAILYNGPPLSLQNCPFHRGMNFHLIHGSLGLSKSSTQTASRSVQPFLQGSIL